MLQERITQETNSFLKSVSAELSTWFSTQKKAALAIDEAAGDLVEAIASLSTGGKRLRAQLLYWGWRCLGGTATSQVPLKAAAALELFQTAALIHDDIIDRSDTRRSMPSVHKQLEKIHADQHWEQDPVHFGVSAGVLTGDLALTWSEQLFNQALAMAHYPQEAAHDFHQMRTEVMIGQYLDIHAEVASAYVQPQDAQRRALDVLRFKSAKYSAEHPVALGALLAGGSTEEVNKCREFALALGEAFQIRDDILGIFGDPAITGKPAGDDLREGKRTVIVAIHLAQSSTEEKQALVRVLGKTNSTPAEIAQARQALTSSGALHAAETLVAQLHRKAGHGIDNLDAEPLVTTALHNILDLAVHRDN